MTAVAGVKARETNQVSAMPVERADGPTLRAFTHTHSEPRAMIYTDEARAYMGPRRAYETVDHRGVNANLTLCISVSPSRRAG